MRAYKKPTGPLSSVAIHCALAIPIPVMDSSDDVEAALLAQSASDDESDRVQQDRHPEGDPQPPQSAPQTVRVPFYDAVPDELPPGVEVPAFVYANRVYRWTERNLR